MTTTNHARELLAQALPLVRMARAAGITIAEARAAAEAYDRARWAAEAHAAMARRARLNGH